MLRKKFSFLRVRFRGKRSYLKKVLLMKKLMVITTNVKLCSKVLKGLLKENPKILKTSSCLPSGSTFINMINQICLRNRKQKPYKS